jgi:hypothetical protein
MRKRILSLCMALCVVVSMFPVTAFAEAGAPDNGTAVITGGLCEHHTHHDQSCGYGEDTPCGFDCEICNGTEEPQEQCSCTVPCTEDSKNSDCPVCGTEDADLSACKGVEPENGPQLEKLGPDSACTCTTRCAEGAVNPDCPVCAAEGGDLSVCEGTAPVNGPQLEKLGPDSACTCTTRCTEGAVDATCPVCSAADADLSACKGAEGDSVIEIENPITIGMTSPSRGLYLWQVNTATLPAGMTAAGVAWSPNDYRFWENVVYTATISYEVEDGYELPANPTFVLPERAKSATIDTDAQTITVVFEPIVRVSGEILIMRGSDPMPVPKAGPGETTFAECLFLVLERYSCGFETSNTGDYHYWGAGDLPEGVTLDTSGQATLRVSNTAQPGTATVVYWNNDYSELLDSLSITITKEKSVPTYLVMVGEVDQITVPLEGEKDLVIQPFTCEAYDQYGQPYDLGQDQVTWRVETDSPGISIDPSTGVLTVTSEAVAGIITIRVEAQGVGSSVEVPVNKVGVIPASVQITESPDTIAVPVLDAFAQPTSVSEQLAAEVYDQNGSAIYGKNIIWSIEGGSQPGVVEISPSGLLTVYTNTERDTVTIRASCEGVFATKEITLSREEEQIIRSVGIDGPDTIQIPDEGSVEIDYSACFYDQYGRQIPETDDFRDQPVWDLIKDEEDEEEEEEEKVGFTDTYQIAYGKTLRVEAGAQRAVIQIQVNKNGQDNPKGVKTIRLISSQDPRIIVLDGEGGNPLESNAIIRIPYGEYSESNPYKLWYRIENAGDASANGIENSAVNVLKAGLGSTWTDGGYYTITPKRASEEPVTLTLIYEIDGSRYTATCRVIVEPKALTAADLIYDGSAGSQQKVYDGTIVSSAKVKVKAESLVGSDTLTITGTARYDDADAGIDKTITFTPDPITSGSYRLSSTEIITFTDGEIIPRPAKAAPTVEVTKEYDGTTAYTGTVPMAVTGLIPADADGSLSLSGCTYESADAGQEIPLTFDSKDVQATGFTVTNYSFTYLDGFTGTITPKKVEVTLDQDAADYGSVPEKLTGSYVDVNGETQTGVTITSAGQNGAVWPNAGTYDLTAVIDDSNYQVDSLSSTTFTIHKVQPALTGKTIQVRYSNTGEHTIDTTGIAEIPGSFTVASVEDRGNILDKAPSGGDMAFQLKDGLAEGMVGSTATVTLTFTPEDSSNYQTAAVEVTILLSEKDGITDIVVEMADWTYGDTPSEVSAGSATAEDGGSWTYSYQGTLRNGGDYDPSSEKPADPGSYTVTATYENDTQKGSGSAAFTIAPKALGYDTTGLTVAEKTYNGSDNAVVTGTLAYTGVEPGDTLDAPVYTTAVFADAEAKNDKVVTVSAPGNPTGDDGWKYTAPDSFTLTGTIAPKEVEITVDQTSAIYGSVPELTGRYSDITGAGKTDVTITPAGQNGAVWPNAGTYDLTVAIGDSNYTAASVVPGTFVIRKASLAPESRTLSMNYSDTDPQELDMTEAFQNLPGTLAVGSVAGEENILGQTEVSGKKATFRLAEGLTQEDVGKTATVTLTFTPDGGNYENGTMEVTIQVTNKAPITDITVAMAGWTYGDAGSEPVGTTGATGGSWTYSYTGTALDGSGYGPSGEKPADPGSYTVTATYESSTHKGSGSTAFTIAPKALDYDTAGLTVAEKTYDGTSAAAVTGALAYAGVVPGDTLDVPSYAAVAFDSPQAGTGKTVTVSGISAPAGQDAWKYTAPVSCTLTGNIVVPTQPVSLGDAEKRLVVRTIDEAYSGYDPALTAAYGDPDAVKSALIAEAQKTIPTIGSNIAYYDLEVEELQSGTWTLTNEGAAILFPYPSGTGRNTVFAVIHMKDDGTLEALEATHDGSGYGITVSADSTSPFAVAWRNAGGGNTGGSDSDDDEDDFWNKVKVRIDRAEDGSTVRVDAGHYDKMSWTVMQALRSNPGVSLVVNWKGGDTVVIPAGKALPDEAGRIYYPLSYLLEQYEGQSQSAPSVNPETGGVIVIQAPAASESAPLTPTPSTQGIDPEQKVLESTPLSPAQGGLSGAGEMEQGAAEHSPALAVAAVAAVLAALSLWILWKRRSNS